MKAPLLCISALNFRWSSYPNPKSQLVCYPYHKMMEITIKNAVLLFSATNEEPSYEQYIVLLILVKIFTICLGTYLR